MGKSRVAVMFLVVLALLLLSRQNAFSEAKTELSIMQGMKGVTVVTTKIPVGNITIPCMPSKYRAEAISIEATAIIVLLLDNRSEFRTGISLDFEKYPKQTLGFGFAWMDKEEVEGLINAITSMVNIYNEREKYEALYAEETFVSCGTKTGFEVTSKYYKEPQFAYMDVTMRPDLAKEFPRLSFQFFEIPHLEKFAELLDKSLETIENGEKMLNLGKRPE